MKNITYQWEKSTHIRDIITTNTIMIGKNHFTNLAHQVQQVVQLLHFQGKQCHSSYILDE